MTVSSHNRINPAIFILPSIVKANWRLQLPKLKLGDLTISDVTVNEFTGKRSCTISSGRLTIPGTVKQEWLPGNIHRVEAFTLRGEELDEKPNHGTKLPYGVYSYLTEEGDFKFIVITYGHVSLEEQQVAAIKKLNEALKIEIPKECFTPKGKDIPTIVLDSTYLAGEIEFITSTPPIVTLPPNQFLG